ncbi:UPF0678 fatty acid-binding protein-like protein [Tanacetum coccineum]
MRKMEGGARVVHPAIESLSYLIGTWKGTGEGGFPTISSFSYGEELTFTHPGNKTSAVKMLEKPVIAYSQKTWKLSSGEPMHAESGYWRPKPDGTIEVVIAQSTGLVEIQKGTYDAEKKEINLQSELVGNASKLVEVRLGDWDIVEEAKWADWLTNQIGQFLLSVKTLGQLYRHSLVKEISRVFTLVNEELTYVVEMATNLTSRQPHLKASLKKL